MTLEQLRTFLWVARLGGVRKAAEQMNISQPAVSARITSLESDLGTALFSRGPTGVTLTKQGVLLRNHAEQIAALVERIKADVMPADSVSSLLRLGVAETVAQTWLPDFIARLHQTYPKLKIEVSVEHAEALMPPTVTTTSACCIASSRAVRTASGSSSRWWWAMTCAPMRTANDRSIGPLLFRI